MLHLKKLSVRFVVLVMIVLGLGLVACSASTAGGDEPAMEEMSENMDHDESMEHDEHMEHDDDKEHESGDGHAGHGDSERIMNPNGASITITAPAEGATVSSSEDLLVEVSVENFDLSADGNHWHVYIDGTSWGMVTGGNIDQALRGMEPGMHEISVFLAGGDHIEFMEGDAIMVMVE
ncbi:MAG: hypothetical protein AAF614_22360 [Chloroflexota bacterium]